MSMSALSNMVGCASLALPLDVYVPHTDLFFMWFINEIVLWAMKVI